LVPPLSASFSLPTAYTTPIFNQSAVGPIGSPPIGFTGGGVLDSIGSVVGSVIDGVGAIGSVLGNVVTNPGVLDLVRALSNAGVIRGSVGTAFRTPQTNSVSAAGMGEMGAPLPTTNILQTLLQQLAAGNSVGDGTMTGNMLSGFENLLGVNQFGGCGSRTLRVPMAQAMGLYKQGGNRQYIPPGILGDGPDGVPVVLYNAGQATIGSREHSVAKSIARRHGLKLCRPGSGSRRSYRRRPR